MMTGMLEAFSEIMKRNEPVAPYTYFKLGGPAEMLLQPRSREELAAVLRACFQEGIPFHVMGGGCNVLVRDEGIRGVLLRLTETAFIQVEVEGRTVRAGAGTPLSNVISQAARHALAGIELLIGIPGTIGGALRNNSGDRSAEIGQFVHKVEMLDGRGDLQVRERDDLRFAYRSSNLDDGIIVAAELELETDHPDAIVKRMRKAWIQRKANQPLTFQAAGRIFKNPRGLNAATLIEQAGLAKTRVGGAEVSERDANFIVAHAEASARDVLRLIDLIRSRVQERFGVELELEIAVW